MRYFITGTDTGVGKTVLSLCLINYMYNKGLNPYYIKPFQTGCSHSMDKDSDANFVYKHTTELKNTDPINSMIYFYQNPLAPLFAARDENKLSEISLNKIKKIIEDKESIYSNIIIEGAGGILVPVTDKKLIIDYIYDLDCKVIIAARAGLGTINHTLLTIKTLKTKSIEIAGIVLVNNTKTSAKAIKENIEAIECFSNEKVIGIIENIEDFNSIPSNNIDIFNKLFNQIREQ